MTLKKGTQVKMITGKDKGKTGEIIKIDRFLNKAIVKGINMVKKQVKTTKEKKGGIFSQENLIHFSNLKILDISQNKKSEVKKWQLD